MGVGYALLEYLPLYEDGPGNGQWNLDQYTIAARLGPAGLVLQHRRAAAARADRRAEGHRRTGDVPGAGGDPQRDQRCDRQALRQPSGHRRHDQGSALMQMTTISITVNGKAVGTAHDPGRPVDERLPPRISQPDRHQVRLRHRPVQRLRHHPRQAGRHRPRRPIPASTPPQSFDGAVGPHHRERTRRTACRRRCSPPSSMPSPSSAATARRASSAPRRCCSRRSPARRSRRSGVEAAVADALDGHLCRCTGYVRYYAALARPDPGGPAVDEGLTALAQNARVQTPAAAYLA